MPRTWWFYHELVRGNEKRRAGLIRQTRAPKCDAAAHYPAGPGPHLGGPALITPSTISLQQLRRHVCRFPAFATTFIWGC